MNKEETLYPWTLSLVDKHGSLIDSTTIYAINRPDALKNAYRLLMFQGLSHMKRQLKLRKQKPSLI
jgi:hypothetical protein